MMLCKLGGSGGGFGRPGRQSTLGTDYEAGERKVCLKLKLREI